MDLPRSLQGGRHEIARVADMTVARRADHHHRLPVGGVGNVAMARPACGNALRYDRRTGRVAGAASEVVGRALDTSATKISIKNKFKLAPVPARPGLDPSLVPAKLDLIS